MSKEQILQDGSSTAVGNETRTGKGILLSIHSKKSDRVVTVSMSETEAKELVSNINAVLFDSVQPEVLQIEEE